VFWSFLKCVFALKEVVNLKNETKHNLTKFVAKKEKSDISGSNL
jgi:hypothetical protein